MRNEKDSCTTDCSHFKWELKGIFIGCSNSCSVTFEKSLEEINCKSFVFCKILFKKTMAPLELWQYYINKTPHSTHEDRQCYVIHPTWPLQAPIKFPRVHRRDWRTQMAAVERINNDEKRRSRNASPFSSHSETRETSSLQG